MKSLNDIIEFNVEVHGGCIRNKGVNIEFDFDPTMPNIYPDDDIPTYLSKTLLELTLEQNDAKIIDNSITKLRFGTLYVDDTQVLIIDHNGNPIPNDTLTRLNEELSRIGNGEHRRGRYTGNVRAAVQASKGGVKLLMKIILIINIGLR